MLLVRHSSRIRLLNDALEPLRQGWPVQVEGYDIPAPYSAPSAGPPPWRRYRFTFHTAFEVATAEPHGATRWAEGRAAMVQVLKTVHGYDHAQADALITALMRAGKLWYHRFGYTQARRLTTACKKVARRMQRSLHCHVTNSWVSCHSCTESLARIGRTSPRVASPHATPPWPARLSDRIATLSHRTIHRHCGLWLQTM